MNHELRRLISVIESRLTGSGGTLVFYGSSVHFGGLDKLLLITKDILRNGSRHLDSEGNLTFLPFALEILPIKTEMEFDNWIKDKMAHSLFSQALSHIVTADASLKRHYDNDALLRCPNSTEKLLLAAKCLDEQDLPTLVALDLRKHKWSYEEEEEEEEEEEPDFENDPKSSRDEYFFVSEDEGGLSSLIKEDEVIDEVEDSLTLSTSCPGLTELEIGRFLKKRNWLNEDDEASSTNSDYLKNKNKSPLPKELEQALQSQLEAFNNPEIRPKTCYVIENEDFFNDEEPPEGCHSTPIVPVRGAEFLGKDSADSAILLSPKKTHRRAMSDTPVGRLMASGCATTPEAEEKGKLEDTEHNWSTVTPPTEGWRMPLPLENESLYSYLSSGAFSRHQARLDRENAHLILAELIIQTSTKQYGDPCMGEGVISKSSFRPPVTEVKNYNDNFLKNSAESIALSLLDQFDDKHEIKASELNTIIRDHQTLQELSFSLSLSNYYECSDESIVTCKDEVVTELRGTHDWAPPRPQLILQLHSHKSRSILLEEQKYRCAGCAMKVEKKYSKTYRYCHYFGKLFCTGCHSNASHVIPAHVIKKWNFKSYFVSDFALTVLHSMYLDPLFNIQDLNSELLAKVSKLRKAVEVRTLSTKIYPFVMNCRLETQYVSDISNYPVIDPYVFSLKDLVRVKSKNYSSTLFSLLENLMQHIMKCSLCKARGFLCEGCRSQDILFPFETDVRQCLRCYACYHKPCFNDNCSKCQRIDLRKNAARNTRS